METAIVNGIKYTSKYITDEELAVVNSMRAGANVDVTFYNSDMDTAMSHLQSTPLELFNKRRITDVTNRATTSFVCVSMKTNDHMVEINHCVDVTRKSEVTQ